MKDLYAHVEIPPVLSAVSLFFWEKLCEELDYQIKYDQDAENTDKTVSHQNKSKVDM